MILGSKVRTHFVRERLYDPPYIEHEVGRKSHESARCGRRVGAQSAERSEYQVLTPTSFDQHFPSIKANIKNRLRLFNSPAPQS